MGRGWCLKADSSQSSKMESGFVMIGSQVGDFVSSGLKLVANSSFLLKNASFEQVNMTMFGPQR